MREFKSESLKIGVVGLGYVGLPLLTLLSEHFSCIGFDVDRIRIEELRKGHDCKKCNVSEEIPLESIQYTSDWKDIQDCNTFFICAPTPVGKDCLPDISILKDICRHLGTIIKADDLVIFESTVSPGTTEEICGNILESISGMKINTDFRIGYSPERINIGDTVHTLKSTPKIISGSDRDALAQLAYIYDKALDSELVFAPNIKTAEAAKIYENVQRDALIALANEMEKYCKAEKIDITEVTRCASSKWNFSKVMPGLVGGHCIGVDPYYLIHRAEELQLKLPLVSLAREVNEMKAKQVAERIENRLKNRTDSKEGSVLLLGFSYKPDTCDTRNTKVADVIKWLNRKEISPVCYDPHVDKDIVFNEYGIRVENEESAIENYYDLVVRLVDHKKFEKLQIMAGEYCSLSAL